MSVKHLQGLLSIREWGEGPEDILFCGETIVAEWAEDEIGRAQVSIRYWITDKQCTKAEASQDFLDTVVGAAETEFGSRYSDVTGYLWTDEEFKVGGHDMIRRLSEPGKWLILEVTIH